MTSLTIYGQGTIKNSYDYKESFRQTTSTTYFIDDASELLSQEKLSFLPKKDIKDKCRSGGQPNIQIWIFTDATLLLQW